MSVRVQLEDWEWEIVDAEAAALGVTRQELLRELIVEGAEFVLNDMNAVFQATDRQWKSH